jgi:hypothetical protein
MASSTPSLSDLMKQDDATIIKLYAETWRKFLPLWVRCKLPARMTKTGAAVGEPETTMATIVSVVAGKNEVDFKILFPDPIYEDVVRRNGPILRLQLVPSFERQMKVFSLQAYSNTVVWLNDVNGLRSPFSYLTAHPAQFLEIRGADDKWFAFGDVFEDFKVTPSTLRFISNGGDKRLVLSEIKNKEFVGLRHLPQVVERNRLASHGEMFFLRKAFAVPEGDDSEIIFKYMEQRCFPQHFPKADFGPLCQLCCLAGRPGVQVKKDCCVYYCDACQQRFYNKFMSTDAPCFGAWLIREKCKSEPSNLLEPLNQLQIQPTELDLSLSAYLGVDLTDCELGPLPF